MSLHILWTPIALQSLSDVFEYTYNEFGERQLRRLTSQIYAATRRIAAYPQLGKRETELTAATGIEYRSTVVISEIKLLYTISQDTLYVEFVKNARMNESTMLERLASL